MKRKTSDPAARPASELDLTPEEIGLLEDAAWVTEDEADVIVSRRREHEATISLDEVRKRRGLDRTPHPQR